MTLAKIAAFQNEYQGSAEEREDVLRAYVDCQGKMARLIDCVMLATDGASRPSFVCISCVVRCGVLTSRRPSARKTLTNDDTHTPVLTLSPSQTPLIKTTSPASGS